MSRIAWKSHGFKRSTGRDRRGLIGGIEIRQVEGVWLACVKGVEVGRSAIREDARQICEDVLSGRRAVAGHKLVTIILTAAEARGLYALASVGWQAHHDSLGRQTEYAWGGLKQLGKAVRANGE